MHTLCVQGMYVCMYVYTVHVFIIYDNARAKLDTS